MAVSLALVWITSSAIWFGASVRQRAITLNGPSVSTPRVWSFASVKAVIRLPVIPPNVSALDAALTLPSVDSLIAPPPNPSRLASWPRSVPFLKSGLRIEPLRISRLSIDPVASPYETPPSETNRAMTAITRAGEGVRMRRFTMNSSISGACAPNTDAPLPLRV
jgi:hypothetical protein